MVIPGAGQAPSYECSQGCRERIHAIMRPLGGWLVLGAADKRSFTSACKAPPPLHLCSAAPRPTPPSPCQGHTASSPHQCTFTTFAAFSHVERALGGLCPWPCTEALSEPGDNVPLRSGRSCPSHTSCRECILPGALLPAHQHL